MAGRGRGLRALGGRCLCPATAGQGVYQVQGGAVVKPQSGQLTWFLGSAASRASWQLGQSSPGVRTILAPAGSVAGGSICTFGHLSPRGYAHGAGQDKRKETTGLTDRLSALAAKFAEIDDIQRAAAVLGWDQMTYMPQGGNAARGEQLATLASLAHERLTSPELRDLLSAFADEVRANPGDALRQAFLRTAQRAYDQAAKLPRELVARQMRLTTEAYEAWVIARLEKDFSLFAPAFAKIVELNREIAEAIGYQGEAYDALLDFAEPGITAQAAAELLGGLKEAFVPLVQRIAERKDRVDRSLLFGHFPEAAQWQLGLQAVEAFGFDFRRGRQDRSIHPFTTSFAVGDVRITTRIDETTFASGLFSTLHEGGHGLYEQGLPAEWARTPLGQAVSSGVHESQSRLWENLVGRSRPFWRYFLPRAKEAFGSQLAAATVEDVYRAVNYVEPSLIRVDADEVTYNLHIAVRFEVERALMRGELKAQDVPAAWTDKMQAYLDVTPPDDLSGPLQDIHWTSGLGGFVGYTVGNVVAGQLWRAAEAAIGDLGELIARGEFAPLLAFLRREVHGLGSRETTDGLMRRVTGEGLTTKPYLDYIQAKFGEIYGL